MFEFLKQKKLNRLTEQAQQYLQVTYEQPKPAKKPEPKKKDTPKPKDEDIRYSISSEQFSIRHPVEVNQKKTDEPKKPAEEKKSETIPEEEPRVRYSLSIPRDKDFYDADRIAGLLRNANKISQSTFDRQLDRSLNQTFTDKLGELIRERNLRDADVYKAAQMDRRLFSKIMSDRNFKPSKDTALALCFALKLGLPGVIDLLSRAGYTLSHSNRRDVVIEYFFREGVYNLVDINIVLEKLGQKIIGR